MADSVPVICLFVDIGGVLLTNGWDASIRPGVAYPKRGNTRKQRD